MKIATLQFSPRLGEFEDNKSRVHHLVDEALLDGKLYELDLLVGPEMTLTGEFCEIFPRRDGRFSCVSGIQGV